MVYRLVITPEQKQDRDLALNPEQQHYLLRVLRLGNGDRFIAMDGVGHSWMAEIADKSAKIIESVDIYPELPVNITLITSLPKGSGYEQVVRCCTELGVSTFLPVISDRTILKPSVNKVQRWRKIATEAAEQSERQIVPTILPPVAWAEAIATTEHLTQDKYICVARGEQPSLWSCLSQRSPQKIVIATGCEGGWTDGEIAKAIAVGYQPVSLGNRILRAITAPIVALSQAVALLESRLASRD